jgi:hypothetical protein
LRQINADALDVRKVRDTWGKELQKPQGPATRSDGAVSSETANQLLWQLTGDTKYLEKVYGAQIETATDRMFINRQGSLWIDRVYYNAGELQRSRLGGVELLRNNDYPGNVVSWSFKAPANEQSVAILVPEGTPDHVRVVAYNLEDNPVTAAMTGWEVDPGTWEVTQGTHDGDSAPLRGTATSGVDWERSKSMDVTFAPHTTTVLELTLKTPGVPYWSRPDLGIGIEDGVMDGSKVRVTVHSLGAVDSLPAQVVLRDKSGKVVASAKAAPLKAPLDLEPKTEVVSIKVPAGATYQGGSVTVEMIGTVPEITQMNNRVVLP